ncbi:hypothetical protein [Corynebacterium guangdongense]|uniref:Secreted protein n=1 Tax=Corynebacterium guangdongense TaxID=1783348 RepID=A0ABU1ZWS0_9CORY|nr:hypothetical protein [Corynebacterium guangdongense]MDR7328368.1 hypothetical protein [Corynebacterium guangdongense]WJZ16945.1 hypothetical protein CGUA_01725 [Corynebacterium guangdongense]
MSKHTTTTYYGNHEPYITPEPRKPWGRRLLVALGVVAAGTAVIEAAPPLEFNTARTRATDAVVDFLTGSEPHEEGTFKFATPESPVTLQVGDSLIVPCSDTDPASSSCMVLTLMETPSLMTCENGTGDQTPHAVLNFFVTMPDDADPDFPGPFREERWSTAAARDPLGAADRTEEPCLDCDGDDSYLNLATLSPGAWASGNVWLPMPEEPTYVRNGEPGQPIFSVLVRDTQDI